MDPSRRGTKNELWLVATGNAQRRPLQSSSVILRVIVTGTVLLAVVVQLQLDIGRSPEGHILR